jgi:hypothetical protein
MALAEAGARRPRRSGSGLRFSSCAAGSLFGERSAATHWQPDSAPEAARQLVVVARALAATGTGTDGPRLAPCQRDTHPECTLTIALAGIMIMPLAVKGPSLIGRWAQAGPGRRATGGGSW